MSFLRAMEFKVGALVITVAGLIAFMSMQVSDDPSYLGRSRKNWFLLPNAAGLIKNSAVRSAGIPVGVIKDIRLQDGQARIDISIKSELPMTTSAIVQIKSIGILGDKHVEVYPGSPNDPPLAEGAQILNVRDNGSLDNLVGEISEISGSLKATAEALRESVTGDGTRKHILGRIVHNIEKLTADLSEMTGENKEKIADIVDQVHSISGTLDELVNDDSDKGFKKTWKKTMERIDSTMKNIDEIAAKVNRGEGTIGKLINDDTTVEELNTAIQGVSNMVDAAGKISTGFEFHGDYLGSVGSTKSYIGVRIQPGLDRYYQIGIIDDPAGVVDKTDVTTTVGAGTPSTTVEEKRFYNKTKLTLLYAKNFWNWTVKGGLIENSGGLGVDYSFWRERIKLSVEAFNFSSMNVRAGAQLNLSHGFYLSGGINDAMDNSGAKSSYLGVGLFLTNDDLKLLLTKAPL